MVYCSTKNADEIIQNADSWINAKKRYNNTSNKHLIDMAYGHMNVSVLGNDYSVKVVVGIDKKGYIHLYDFADVKPIKIKKGTNTAPHSKRKVDIVNDSSRNKVTQDNNKVNNIDEKTKFQDRNTEPSNREILATALKSTAVNETERENIIEYQKNIEKLNELDKKYDVVDGAIKDLWKSYFETGKKETQTIEDLTTQKESLRRKIKYYDGKLLKLESTTALKNLLEREKAAAVKKQRQVDSEKLKAYRKAQSERFDRQQKRYQDMAKSKVENRRRIEARNKVIKRIDKLNAYLEKPDNKKYIPAGFMQSTVSLLKNLNQDVMNVAQRADEMRERMAGYA